MTTPQETKGSQHTPGPWRWSENALNMRTASINANGTPIANVHLMVNDHHAESIANARLIAAAPALVTALRLALHDLQCGCRGAEHVTHCGKRAIRAALALVHGREGD